MLLLQTLFYDAIDCEKKDLGQGLYTGSGEEAKGTQINWRSMGKAGKGVGLTKRKG